jgi:hypothetical protein
MDFDQEAHSQRASTSVEAGQTRLGVANVWPAVLAVSLAVVPLAMYLYDRTTTHTELITPISPFGLTVMRALGTFGGLLVAFVLLNGRDLAIYRKVILFLMIPCGGFALGDGIAWRIADHWNFGNSTVPYTQARYPIVNVKGGGKSHTYSLGIDPYGTGETARIGIPYEQYRNLVTNYTDQCVTVEERRAANGAVEINTLQARLTASGEAEVGPCGQAQSPWNQPSN